MKNLIKLLLVLTIAFSMTACAFTNMFSHNGRLLNSSNGSFKRGDYLSSSLALIYILQGTPNHVKALELLNHRLEYTVNVYNSDIKNLNSKKNSTNKWKNLGEKYADLTTLHIEYYRLSQNTQERINYDPYDITNLKNKAAMSYYNSATAITDNGKRETKKKISKLLEKVIEYNPNYKDVQNLSKRIKTEAMQRVILKEINEKNRYDIEVGNLIYDSVFMGINNNTSVMKYTILIDRDSLEEQIEELKLQQAGFVDSSTTEELGKLIGANIIIKMNITGIEYIEPSKKVNEIGRTKNINIGTKENPIIQKASYLEYQYIKESKATVIVSYSILDIATGVVIKKDEKIGQAYDRVRWSKYSDAKYGRDQMEKNTRSKLEIVRAASKDASKQIYKSINNYLK